MSDLALPTVERIVPQNLEAEICVLGSVILKPDALADVAYLDADEFFRPAHRSIYQALRQLQADGKPIDLVSLSAELKRLNVLEQVGGNEYLVELAEGVPSACNAEYYASEVRDAAIRREAIVACGQAIQDLYGHEPTQELLDALLGRLGASVRQKDHEKVLTVGQAAEMALEAARTAADGGPTKALKTGFASLDKATGGYLPGELWVVGGATGCGKTAFADSMTLNLARGGAKILICSAEMMSVERGKRLLQSESQVAGQRIKLPKNLSPEQWTELLRAQERLSKLAIGIYAKGSMTAADVCLQARRTSLEFDGLDLVVVDYIQLLTPENKAETRARAVGDIVWALKRLAMDMPVRVMALSQIRREGLKSGKPPSMYDLRESGDIENHANVVVLLHRPENVPEDQPEVWAKLAKARDGIVTPWPDTYPYPRSCILLNWHAETTTFEEG